MARDFGIYPTTHEPKLWWGARAIITDGRIDIPWDRHNFDGDRESTDKDDFFYWINNTAIPELNKRIKKYETKGIRFSSEGGRFHCEADDHNSGGYLYIGCYTIE